MAISQPRVSWPTVMFQYRYEIVEMGILQTLIARAIEKMQIIFAVLGKGDEPGMLVPGAAIPHRIKNKFCAIVSGHIGKTFAFHRRLRRRIGATAPACGF